MTAPRKFQRENWTLKWSLVLELGTFTGVSALIFHEATKKTQAEIVSMDMSETYLKYAEDAFRRHGATDRIRTVQGPCLEMFVLLPMPFSGECIANEIDN